MNKAELIKNISEKSGLTKNDSELALKAFISTVEDALVNGEKIQLTGFGTFDVVERSARDGRNPKTGEAISIEACKSPKFKASKQLKDAINQ